MTLLNKLGYIKLIEEDIEELEKSSIPSLEKAHINCVLRWSIGALYPNREECRELERIQNRLMLELQKQKDAGKQFVSDKEVDDIIDEI